jgi:hypothetical protein
MNPTSFVTSSRSSARTTSTAGPLVFQYETPQGHRYHVAGKGFTAENIGDATRYPVNASWDDVALDPFIPDGGHLAALALVEIAAIEETAIRASEAIRPRHAPRKRRQTPRHKTQDKNPQFHRRAFAERE